MRRETLFWGLALIGFGVLLLLENLGFFKGLNISIWSLFWPALLIIFGVQMLWGAFFRRPAEPSEHISIPLHGVPRARLELRHGAGRIELTSGAPDNLLVTGDCHGGIRTSQRVDGDLLVANLSVQQENLVITPGISRGYDWDLQLNENVELAIDLQSGANEVEMDLSDLRVTDLQIGTGASRCQVDLPENAGHTRVRVSSGAASIEFEVPDDVAALIHHSGGLSTLHIDEDRFPRTAGGYMSPDYATARNRVEFSLESGLATITIQ